MKDIKTISLTITVPRTEANARAMEPGNTSADDLAAQRRGKRGRI